jgi:pyridoxamine 5'-phosphate oxidase
VTDQTRLPDSLPAEPFTIFQQWLSQAVTAARTPNPNAMCVATVDEAGRPAARIVLCKRVAAEPGYIVFFTNYESAKGRHLARHGFAEAVFLWDAQGRQARLAGPVLRSPAPESDEYFRSRARESRIGAWASRQSQPVGSREQLLRQLDDASVRFAEGDVPRPPHWGGQRIWPTRMELWTSGDARIHDRAVWTREVDLDGTDTPHTGHWSCTRLQP